MVFEKGQKMMKKQKYEVDLFGEERSVCYMAKLIFEGLGNIDDTVVKSIKSRIAKT